MSTNPEIIKSIEEDVIREYPLPYFYGDKEEITEAFNNLKKKYKDAIMFHFLDYSYAICLDKYSVSYYAATLLGATYSMAYCNFYYSSLYKEEAESCEKEFKELIQKYEIEGVFKVPRKDL